MRSLILMFLVAVGLACGAGPAAAGGPTSALITMPSESRAAALYHTDSGYRALQVLLDTGTAVVGANDHGSGSYVNVTWLVHDVHIWRTDRILLDAPGGPAVETTLHDDPAGESQPVRRNLDKPAQLTALLAALGLTGAPGGTAVPVAPAAQQAPLPAVAAGYDARWEWGIGGVLLGALAAGLVVRVRKVRAAR